MNKYIFHISIFLYSVFFSEGCRCTRDFEDENAYCKSHVTIEIKLADDKELNLLPQENLTISEDKRKATIYVDLDENGQYKSATVTKKDGNKIIINIFYTNRKKLVSINKGSILEYKITSVECSSAKRCTVENHNYLNTLEKDADVQIFI